MFDVLSLTESYVNFKREDLPHEYLKLLYFAWQSNAENHGGTMPTVENYSLLKIGPAVDYMALVKLFTQDDVLRPRYIYSGRGLDNLYGEKVAGHYLDELFKPRLIREPMKAYQELVKRKKPIYTRRMARTPIKVRGYDRLILPLTNLERLHNPDSGNLVSHAILCLIPNDREIKTFEDWRMAEDMKDWISHLEELDEGAAENAPAEEAR